MVTQRPKQNGRKAKTLPASVRGLVHHRAAQESAMIADRQWRFMGKMASAEIQLNAIIKALNAKKIPFVLTGAHALGGWTGAPRATKDVDILVTRGRNHARAVKALLTLYPSLEVRTFFGVTGFFVPGEKQSVIDVTYPHRADIQETLARPLRVKVDGLSYRIPTLEAALANKYGAMLAVNRDAGKRLQDAADFTNMVQHSLDEGRQRIDLQKLTLLGEKVWPDGGGAEIIALVETVVAGGIVDLNALTRKPSASRMRLTCPLRVPSVRIPPAHSRPLSARRIPP
jgi:hypothetical protein